MLERRRLIPSADEPSERIAFAEEGKYVRQQSTEDNKFVQDEDLAVCFPMDGRDETLLLTGELLPESFQTAAGSLDSTPGAECDSR